MHTVTRKRETIFLNYIFKHHSYFIDQDIPMWYCCENQTSIEGGDILAS